MKYLFFLMIIVISVRAQNEQDTLAVFQNRDTLYYYWTAYEDIQINQRYISDYNGNIFITQPYSYDDDFYYSDDFLETWNKMKWIAANDSIRTFHHCLLPNNKIVVSGNYYLGLFVNGKFRGSGIKIYDIESETWETYKENDFKNHKAGYLFFKDSNTGILSTRDSAGAGKTHLFKTTNGGKDWEEIYQFSDKYISVAGPSTYFKKDNILLLVLNYYKDDYNRKRYLLFSKDFGETWEEIKDYPIKYKVGQSSLPSDAFYMRNDSIWHAGSYRIGIQQNEHGLYNFIMFSSDMGNTWKTQYFFHPPTLTSFNNINFLENSSFGILTESFTSRLYITFDYGENWRIMGDPKNQDPRYPPRQEDKDYNQLYDIINADNKIVVIGKHGVYVLNNLNVPTGVGKKDDNSIFNVYYDNRNQIINIKSAESELIDRIELYTASGKALYSNNTINRPEYQIPSYEINNTKIVFAIIYSGNQMYLKKVLCE